MRILKLVVVGMVGAAVIFLAGWLYGRGGKTDLADALQAADVRLSLATARAAALDARVGLYNLNFGDAARRLDDAKTALETGRRQIQAWDNAAADQAAADAIERITEAQRLAARVDQSANQQVAEAVAAIDAAIAGLPPPPPRAP
ncbi:MAG: hypothetical protein HYX76_03230 [Acidobacteria bacterium]|nr:hypothetical protein [Acidobacteriota bacterium]